MVRKLKEASVKVDINGLESSDLEMLSRMLQLAGQAEQSAALTGTPDLSQGVSALDINTPSTDIGNGVPNTDVDPSMGVSMVDNSAPEIDIVPDENVDITMQPELESEGDALGDVVGHDDISNEMDSMFDESFDMAAMRRIAGLNEDISDDNIDEDNESSDGDSDSEELDEARLLPDLSLNEEPEEDFGPFRSQQECTMNAEMETNGVVGNNFIVMTKPDGFYWKRTVQEDAENRPDPYEVDTDGIQHARHEYRHKRTKLGDNTILTNIHESDEEDDESVEELHESLNERYKKFLGEK